MERRKTSDVDQMIHGRRFSRPGLRSTTYDRTCIEKVINHLLSTFMQRRDIMRESTLRNDFLQRKL